MVLGDQLTSGFRNVVDCVGSAESLKQALRVVAPGGEVLLVGMPSNVSLELTSLWHREVAIRGCYAYTRNDFMAAIEIVRRFDLGRLVSATYPLDDYKDAIAHAAVGRPPWRSEGRLRHERKLNLMPRPGFVLEVDRSTPPIMFWRGENFSLEKLPAGRSRVIYPPEPLAAIEDIDGAIRNALLNPHDQDPLPAQLFPGMKLTIAFDDVSLPLPKMRTPDNRQRIIEAVLDLAADAGVDDVHIIAALGLHRRMHEYELRHALGDRVYDAFHPRGTLYQHDAEDRDNLAVIGSTPEGEVLEISKRAADSDLIVYVNINSVAMDGGWKSITTGLASYRSLSFHHNPETLQNTRSLMDRHKSELHKSVWRLGKVMRDHGPKVFQIESTLNTDMFPSPFDFLSQARVGVEGQGPRHLPGDHEVTQSHADRLARKIFHSHRGPAPDDQRAGRRHRGRAQDHARVGAQAAAGRGARVRPTS